MQKIARHLNLDSKAEQIIEDWDISDYELEKTCDVLDIYWNDPKREANNFHGIKYHEVKLKIRSNIGTENYSKVKEILRAIYWREQYQSFIARLEFLPAELFDVKRDFEQKEKKNRSAE